MANRRSFLVRVQHKELELVEYTKIFMLCQSGPVAFDKRNHIIFCHERYEYKSIDMPKNSIIMANIRSRQLQTKVC